MTKVQIIYWRDIPVQVRVRNDRFRHSQPLSARFQQTVYRAAYRAKAITGDTYIMAWRLFDLQEREGEPDEVQMAILRELEAAYPDDVLDQLALNNGYKEK